MSHSHGFRPGVSYVMRFREFTLFQCCSSQPRNQLRKCSCLPKHCQHQQYLDSYFATFGQLYTRRSQHKCIALIRLTLKPNIHVRCCIAPFVLFILKCQLEWHCQLTQLTSLASHSLSVYVYQPERQTSNVYMTLQRCRREVQLLQMFLLIWFG